MGEPKSKLGAEVDEKTLLYTADEVREGILRYFLSNDVEKKLAQFMTEQVFEHIKQ